MTEEQPIYFALRRAEKAGMPLDFYDERRAAEYRAEREARAFYQRVNNQHYAFRRKLTQAGCWPKRKNNE